MPKFGEQPISNERKDFYKNQDSIEAKKKAIAEAAATGDFDKIIALAQEAKGLEGKGKELVDNAHKTEAETEDAERAVAKEKLAQDALQKKQIDSGKYAEILNNIKNGGVEAPAEVVEQVAFKKAENIVLQDGDTFLSFEENLKDSDGKYSAINNSRQQRLFEYIAQKYPELSMGSEDYSKWNENYKKKYNEIVNAIIYQEKVANHPHVLKNYPGLSFEDFVKNKKQILDEINFRSVVDSIKKEDFSKSEIKKEVEKNQEKHIEEIKKYGLPKIGQTTVEHLYATGVLSSAALFEALGKSEEWRSDRIVEEFPSAMLNKMADEEPRFQDFFQLSLERALKGQAEIGGDSKLLPTAYRAFIKKIPIDQYHLAKAEQNTGINVRKKLLELESQAKKRETEHTKETDTLAKNMDFYHHASNIIDSRIMPKEQVLDKIRKLAEYANKTKNLNTMKTLLESVHNLEERSLITSEEKENILQSM